MIDQNNPLAHTFGMARGRFASNTCENLKLKLTEKRESNGRTYDLPTTLEVVALIVGDIGSANKRDIIIETKGGKLQQNSELHPSYLAMQLLFPYGEDGFRTDIMHMTPTNGSTGKRFKLTMRDFFAYKIQDRACEAAIIILLSWRLLQQFLVDAYTMIEAEMLSFLRHNQQSLRATNVKNLRGVVERGETEGSTSFTGEHSYMRENYQDAMAICR